MIQNDSLSPSSDPAANENLWLEVRRGQTRAPHRAVRTRRFLIGAGSNCQLQLGGDDVPILHSILLVDKDGAQIDTVVPNPELFVNGVPHRAAQLRDGDVLNIGKFEFAVHIRQPVDADAGQEGGGQLSDLDANLEETDVADLSVSEIVSRLEQDLREIGQLQSSRETGAEALLQAARNFGDETADVESQSAEEAVLLQLQQLSHTLQQRVASAISRTGATAQRQSGLLSLAGGDAEPAATDDTPSRRKAS